ncbi:CACTA en-spm transposon protein [Cucumis melo var. makuwa]|uniref:CACTA en-spm transposon protein n=1 Tax=Cucumis melo var. makuwa TaxID=1194695 RepID=A0A5A7T5V5_CUCMM|nr:CACTA en-spm transposon protein [Cucumis melo var. makuwa]
MSFGLATHYIEVVKGGLHEQSRTNKFARAKQPYNHSSRSKSFLQQQHEFIEKRGQPVGHVELFKETHANRSDQFDQMLELQSQPTPEGLQPLVIDQIYEIVLDR